MNDIPEDALRSSAARSLAQLVAAARPHEQVVLLKTSIEGAFGLLLALDRVEASQLVEGLSLMALARREIAEHHSRPPWKVTVAEVAVRHGMSVDDLLSRSSTTRAHTDARREAYVALRSVKREDGRPAWSYPAIGRMFGRDHTTILHALKSAAGGRS